MMRKLTLALAVACAGLTLFAAPLRAQEQPAEPPKEEPAETEPAKPVLSEEQRAEALRMFDEGRAKMQVNGQLDAACELFTKSYAIHNRGDTLLNLAECHRRQGKTATAWREFDEAIRYAKEVEFTEAIAAAEILRDSLTKDLSVLIVSVPPEIAKAKGLTVILDGKPLPREQWDQKLFVDPGDHGVSASASGFKPFEKSTEVKKLSDTAVIKLAMEKLPPPPPPPKKPPPPKPIPKMEPGHVPAWSIIVGASGLVMMGVAIATGVDTTRAHQELDDTCGIDRQGCPSDYDFHAARAREIRSFGMFVGFGLAGIGATTVGGVGLGLGLKSKPKKDVAFTPWFSPTGAGLGISGTLR